MRENSAPLVNSAPTTFSSMKLGFLAIAITQQLTKIHIIYEFWQAVNYYCNSIARKPNFIELNVVGAEFTNGAEFSRIYGTLI